MSSKSYQEEYNIALNYYANNKIPEAYSAFQELLKKHPDKPPLYYFLSIIEADFHNNIKLATETMLKAVEIVPFYAAYKELTRYSVIGHDIQNTLKYAKLTLTYNSRCEQTLKIVNKLFPQEANFVGKKETVISGEYQHSKDCPHLKYQKIYEGGTIERKPPKYVEELLTDNQKILLNKAIEGTKINNYTEGFVLNIPDGRAFIMDGNQTHIITPDNKILKDMLLNGCPPLTSEITQNEVRVADKLLVLSSCWPWNYYHWLTWTVPRIAMIEQAGYNLKDFDKIAINHMGYKFHRELLELLGIPKHKIIGSSAEHGMVLRAKTLVTASLPDCCQTPAIVTDSLRERFLKPEYIDDSMPKQIYLSRNKSGSRFVLNENEVYEFLKKLGFEIIYAEDYTFVEQIKIFANADVIIAQHGAGLTNLSFCKPNTILIEIQNETMQKFIDTGYFRICNNVQLNHYLMFGEPVGTGVSSNLNIDINKLTKTLELVEKTYKKDVVYQ